MHDERMFDEAPPRRIPRPDVERAAARFMAWVFGTDVLGLVPALALYVGIDVQSTQVMLSHVMDATSAWVAAMAFTLFELRSAAIVTAARERDMGLFSALAAPAVLAVHLLDYILDFAVIRSALAGSVMVEQVAFALGVEARMVEIAIAGVLSVIASTVAMVYLAHTLSQVRVNWARGGWVRSIAYMLALTAVALAVREVF